MWEQLFGNYGVFGYLWVLWWVIIGIGCALDYDWLAELRGCYHDEGPVIMLIILACLVLWYIVGVIDRDFNGLQLVAMLYVAGLVGWLFLIRKAFSERRLFLRNGDRPQVGITKITATLMAGAFVFTTVHLLCV